MSFKFERDTYKQQGEAAGASLSAAAAKVQKQLSGKDGPIPGTTGKHPISEVIGTAITGGKQNAGTKGYLAVSHSSGSFAWRWFVLRRYEEATANFSVSSQAYIKQLEENPMRTKMLTAGTLSGAQELIASFLAKDRNKNGNYFTSRVPKMAAYGAFVSAPLGSLLIWMLQKIFKGRTSLRAKILQILVSNLVVCTSHVFGNVLKLRLLTSLEDCTDSKCRLSFCHGSDRWREDLPPSARHGARRLLEGHAGQLDHFPSVPGFRTEVPP